MWIWESWHRSQSRLFLVEAVGGELGSQHSSGRGLLGTWEAEGHLEEVKYSEGHGNNTSGCGYRGWGAS